MASKIGVRALRLFARRDGMISSLPFASGWTAARDLPAPAGRTFRELYGKQR
jgi:L-lactate dehydrogenase complex protein LldF